MMRAVIAPLVLAGTAVASAEPAADFGGNSGITKIVQLLKKLEQESKGEMAEEANAYSRFTSWCEETKTTLTMSIQRKDEVIGEQTSVQQENEAKAAAAADTIEKDNSQKQQYETEIAKRKEKRAAAKAEFQTLKADYELSIDAIGRAIAVLSTKAPGKVAQSFLLAQIEQSDMARKQKDFVTMLIQQPVTPQGHAYEGSSGGVVGMLEDLQAQFTKELNEVIEGETNEAGNAASFIQNKEGQVDGLSQNIADQTKRNGDGLQAAGEAKAEVSRQSQAKDTEDKSFRSVKQQCSQRAEEMAEREATRKAELQAIGEAIQAILGIENKDSVRDRADAANAAENTDAVQAVDGAEETAGGPPQDGTIEENSFIQLSARKHANLNGVSMIQKVTEMLQNSGRKLKSKDLQLLALKVSEFKSASKERVDGPMKKVIGMVRDMITKLKAEALKEEGHFGRCDKAMKTNTKNLEASDERIATLEAEIKQAESDAAEAQSALAELAEADIKAKNDLQEAEKNRLESTQINKKTVADSKDAVAAVTSAIEILEKFYEGSKGATALLQQDPVATTEVVVPDTWNKPYEGRQGAGSNIITLMETVQSDFIRLISETETEEIAEVQQHEKFKDEQAIAQAQRDSESNNYKRREADATASASQKKDTLTQESENNAGLLKEKEVIEVDQGCKVHGGKTADDVFEEVHAKRQAEIESLKQALEVLSANDIEDFGNPAPGFDEFRGGGGGAPAGAQEMEAEKVPTRSLSVSAAGN